MNIDFLLDMAAASLRQKAGEDKIVNYIKGLNIKKTGNLNVINKENIKVSAVSMEIMRFRDMPEYVDYINSFVRKAAVSGAQLVCFPELCGLLPLSLIPLFDKIVGSFTGKDNMKNKKQYDNREPVLSRGIKGILKDTYYIHTRLFKELSKAYGIYIMSGCIYTVVGDRLYNRAHLFDKNGELAGTQDKAHLVSFEKELGLSTAEDLAVYRTELGNIAFPICMDATYYETFKIVKSKGAQIVIIPIANMENYNYYMSLRGIEPRIQESRLYGIKSALVGGYSLGLNFSGLSGIFAPVELTENRDGILAVSKNHARSEVVTASVNLKILESIKDEYRDDVNLEFLQRELENEYNNYFKNSAIKG
jgi:predicted amidohydrolase